MHRVRLIACVIGVSILLASGPLPAADDAQYLTGGPLAGVKLPRYPSGPGDEVELYPGAVEHYRAYMTKYLPVRSFFDRQSLLHNWVAPAIPGGEGKAVEEFKPPIYRLNQNSTGPKTDKFYPAAKVIRCKVKDPVFKLDLGELDVGMYAVRVIAAVETEKLRRFREPVFVTLKVNDGLAGETSTYRLRIGYVDDFYSVAEIYFNAPAKRKYQAELFVDAGSTVDLLVHNITLDDVLAGATRKPLKTRTTMHKDKPEPTTNPTVDKLKPLSAEERLARDQAIWKWLPPINAQGQWMDMNVPTPGVTYTHPEDKGEHGNWVEAGITSPGLSGVFVYDPKQYDAFLVNKKLNLRYTIDDLIARKPLPDPYPYKDDGAGMYFPDPQKPDLGHEFSPIAYAVGHRYRNGFGAALGGGYLWRKTGNKEIARDAAVALVRFAYQYPSLDAANWTTAITANPGAYTRDLRCRQRDECSQWMPHYENYLLPIMAYDALYDYIKGNEELAQSVGRFVPWVKTSKDVLTLLDVYLVQHEAKRILRYHDHTIDTAAATLATVVGDSFVTDPWMDWLFSKTFMYPMDPCGIQDLMITGCDRNGPQYIGSAYYAQGEGASPNAVLLQKYIDAGGNTKYDLSNPAVYPKPLAQCRWQLSTVLGGQDFPRVGDVTGPDKAPGATMGDLPGAARNGWRWSGGADERFAWILANIAGRGEASDEEWARIQQAAAKVKRAPWLDNRSRVLEGWFGALETGLEHDDYRFRRCAYVRVGTGYGHQHADTLDLQFVAHGMPMTIDGGQRSGYSKPNDRFSRIHNVVEVNGQGNEEFGLRSHSWVQNLADAPGARYLVANAVPPNGSKLFRRQVALIDVDEGAGSKPLPPAQQKHGVKLDGGVVTADSYIFDVFRVGGGQSHSYCFHGPVNDDFQWNAKDPKPVASVKDNYKFDTDENYLSLFLDAEKAEGMKDPDNAAKLLTDRLPYLKDPRCGKLAGDAPDTLDVTWRCTRDRQGSEQMMLGKNFDPNGPRKYTTLHLLGASGLRAMKAESVSTKFGYHYTNFMGLRRGGDLESAFTAIIEPYAGEPFVAGQRLLEVADNETDALRAVAVEVKTRNGHTDICFADGRPEKTRAVGPVKAAGEFAFYSTDADGLRQATLSGGTLLEGPGVKLAASARERTGKVVAVDYYKKTLKIDQPWPATAGGRVYEIGTPDKTTCYTAVAVKPEGKTATITLNEGADFFRSPIRNVSPDGKVDCVLSFAQGNQKGLAKNWVASNDQMTKFWRADASGNTFKLTPSTSSGQAGSPVTQEDFAPSNAIRLWEYGVGDTVRQSTFVSLRRVEKGVYELTGDVDVEVTLGGKTQKVTADDFAKNGGVVRITAGK